MRLVRLLVTGLIGLVPLAAGPTATAVPAGAVDAKRQATETQDYEVEVFGKTQATQSGGVAHYYCAVGVFAPFNDAQGYDAVRADLVVNGVPTTIPIGDPPYADAATTGGLDFAPLVATHHVQVGTWHEISGDASVLARCDQLRNEVVASVSPSATITYEAVGSCKKAFAKQTKAADSVKKAKKKVKSASGPALAAAQKALARAKDKLSDAKQKVDRACSIIG